MKDNQVLNLIVGLVSKKEEAEEPASEDTKRTWKRAGSRP